MKVDSQDGTRTEPRAVAPELVTENVYVFPVTFAQQRLWFLDQLEPNSASYSVPWSIHMAGKLNARALENSLNEIVRRHETLRTTFSSENGQAVQVVAQSLNVPLPVLRPESSTETRRKKRSARQPKKLRTQSISRTDRWCERNFFASGRKSTSPADHAPHHFRWLVAAHPGARTGCALRSVLRGTSFAVAGSSVCNTPITRCGSANICRARRLKSNCLIGSSSSPALPQPWSCPRTGRARRYKVFAERFDRSRFPRNFRKN